MWRIPFPKSYILGALILMGGAMGGAALVSSCGGVRQTAGLGAAPIDFAFSMGEYQTRLSGLRGAPLVLILMRTSEIASQMYMDEVTKGVPEFPEDVRLLVLTIEPSEAPFIDSYVSFEKLPFPIGIAEPSVVQGASELGVVPGIPCTYLLDSNGFIDWMMPGVVEAAMLIDRVRRI